MNTANFGGTTVPLEEQLARAKIIAPIDAVVRSQELDTRASSFIGLGGVIMEVIDPSVLRVDVDVQPVRGGT